MGEEDNESAGIVLSAVETMEVVLHKVSRETTLSAKQQYCNLSVTQTVCCAPPPGDTQR